MKWKKLGLLFSTNNNFSWMYSHAANPFAEAVSPECLRIYFTCRNSDNQSHIGFVEMNPQQSFKVLRISEQPVVAPGEPGMFDDSGTAMGYLLKVGEKRYLYYLGWNLKVTVPWLNSIGLAISEHDGKGFTKYSRAPIMDRSDEDPFSISYPSVMLDNGIYRMWYGSNLKWGKDQAEMNHVIKYAESHDGIRWERSRNVVVNLTYPFEYALSKPFVLKDHSCYRMWYSFRASEKASTYRIGYAVSHDGLLWKRKDDAVGIDVSNAGWDSEMICYPFVFDWEGRRYMLYNGNGFGKTGFGLAVLE